MNPLKFTTLCPVVIYENYMTKLKVDDVITTDHEVMAEAVDSFFASLLGEAPERVSTLNLQEIGLPNKNLEHLDGDFTDEIWVAIRAQGLDKEPGPDGFPARFYVACWTIIKEDVLAAAAQLQYLVDKMGDRLPA